MNFEDKDRLYDIKIQVEERRKKIESTPSLRIPLSYAEKFLKTYKKKLKPLEDKIGQYWDEPNTMYELQDEYNELEALVTSLEEYIEAMKTQEKLKAN
jgi:hypothetical protein